MPYNNGDDADKIKGLIKRHLLNIINIKAKGNKNNYKDFLTFKSYNGYNCIDFMVFTLKNDAIISFSIDCEPKEVRLCVNLDDLMGCDNVDNFKGFKISIDKKYK